MPLLINNTNASGSRSTPAPSAPPSSRASSTAPASRAVSVDVKPDITKIKDEPGTPAPPSRTSSVSVVPISRPATPSPHRLTATPAPRRTPAPRHTPATPAPRRHTPAPPRRVRTSATPAVQREFKVPAIPTRRRHTSASPRARQRGSRTPSPPRGNRAGSTALMRNATPGPSGRGATPDDPIDLAGPSQSQARVNQWRHTAAPPRRYRARTAASDMTDDSMATQTSNASSDWRERQSVAASEYAVPRQRSRQNTHGRSRGGVTPPIVPLLAPLPDGLATVLKDSVTVVKASIDGEPDDGVEMLETMLAALITGDLGKEIKNDDDFEVELADVSAADISKTLDLVVVIVQAVMRDAIVGFGGKGSEDAKMRTWWSGKRADLVKVVGVFCPKTTRDEAVDIVAAACDVWQTRVGDITDHLSDSDHAEVSKKTVRKFVTAISSLGKILVEAVWT